MKVSLLMLTYNAPRYVVQSIVGIKRTRQVDYELIVVDNNSRIKTKIVLIVLRLLGYIDKLYLNKVNALFAKGNNIASALTSKDSTHYCLINSDIDVKNSMWLSKLCSLHPQNGGISAFGAVLSEPVRADGYCMLINKYLYDKYRLDEQFEWWWSVTKLESQVLKDGYQIVAIKNHEKYLHHYGGASGKGFTNAKGMDIGIDEVKSWFDKKKNDVTIIESV